VLLVLPLLAAAWAFGDYAAQNERSRTDTRLGASLRASASEYARALDEADVLALQLAGSRSVQHALQSRDRRALAQLERVHPNVVFRIGRQAPRDTSVPARRSVEVIVGDRAVGSVVVEVPLDAALLARIARDAGLDKQREVAVAERGGRVVATSAPLSGPLVLGASRPHTVDAGSQSYRTVAASIAPATRLAVLEPTDAVEAAAASSRDRILLIGFLALAAVMLMAYALAPFLGRARFAQQQRAVAERVVAHVGSGVILLDTHGTVRFWNHAAETITGITADRVLGRRAENAIPGWRLAVPQIPVGSAHRPEGRPASATVPLEIGDRELWLSASGVRFADGTVYSFRDISEDERLDQAKADFVATVSHELRTPLAAVYGAALTLHRHHPRLDEPQRDRLLRVIADEAERLSAIIDDILLASRLDSGRLDVARLRFDADAIARAVVEAARVRAPEGIAIALSTPPGLPPATGDGDRVGQILGNLVENAVKYSPGGGRVDVMLEHRDDRIRFEVRDQGLGIPLDEQERIFQKFYRLDPNLTRGIGGTGLGLYISRELVRRMGGEIHVRSSPGRGSSFSFDLAVALAPDRVPQPVGTA
jgi:PAS domain S-box-containing protein